HVEKAEMLRTFNMGVGMILGVPGAKADAAAKLLEGIGETPHRTGEGCTAARPNSKPKGVYAGRGRESSSRGAGRILRPSPPASGKAASTPRSRSSSPTDPMLGGWNALGSWGCPRSASHQRDSIAKFMTGRWRRGWRR